MKNFFFKIKNKKKFKPWFLYSNNDIKKIYLNHKD